jgi:hypothetical protein
MVSRPHDKKKTACTIEIAYVGLRSTSVFTDSVSGFGINLDIFCMYYYIPNDQILLCFNSEQLQIPLKLEPLGSTSHTERDMAHPPNINPLR